MYSQRLNIFLVVAECGSFSKAAQKLYITPAAVMKHMNALEKQLDITLFKRTNQGVELTAAGKLIYQDGKLIVQAAANALEKAKAVELAERKTLKIGSSFLNPSEALTDLWEPFHSQFPEYKFNIVPYSDESNQIVSIIETLGTKYDLIVGTLSNSPQMDRYANHLQLGTYDLCIAVSQRHPYAKKKKLTYRDMYGKHLIMPRNDTAPMIAFNNALKMAHPQIILDFVGYYYDINTFNLCEQSNSLLLTLNAWKNIHPSLVTIPVEWDFKVPYGILYAKNPSETVISFIKILKEQFIEK